MSSFLLAAGLAVGASAAVVPKDQCCFQLTTSGGQSDTVGQLSDGQNRIGGGYSPATYCLSNGGITDSNGRGCILTPPTTQFQCDVGATSTTGFSIGSGSEVEYNGSTQFYACPAADDQYNIYTKPVSGQDKCVKITLSSVGKCSGSGSGYPSASASSGYSPASSVPAYSAPSSSASKPSAPAYSQPSSSAWQPSAPSHSAQSYSASSQSQPSAPAYNPSTSASNPAEVTSAQAPPAYTSTVKSTYYRTTTVYHTPSESKPVETTASQSKPAESKPISSSYAPSGTQPESSAHGSACHASLSGTYQTPLLIVPVSSSQPDKAYGTQYNATINSDECTIFNFDIPQSYSGQSCSVIFLFPEQSQLETSAYTFSGSGDLVFSELSSAANQQTTWNTCRSKKSQLGDIAIKPGDSYAVSTESCAAGTTQSIEVCGTNGLSLEFFEDWNPSPLGVYVVSC